MAVEQGTAAGIDALLEKQPDAIADPYAIYRRMREDGAVVMHGASRMLTRNADIRDVLRRGYEFSNELQGRGSRFEEIMASLPSELADAMRDITAFEHLMVQRADGDMHTRLRRIAHRAFTPKRVATMQEKIEHWADELIDQMIAEGNHDIISGLAYRLPLNVIADLLGVPEEDHDRIHLWSETMADNRGGVDPSKILPARAAIAEFRSYVLDVIERHRELPPEQDLVAALAGARTEERLSDEEMAVMFVLLLSAGHETTTNLIGNGLHALLSDRSQWELLCEQPELAPQAVEETVRYNAPVQFIGRVTLEESEIAGTRVPPDQAVILWIAAANRDPEVHEDPDRFDIARDRASHLGFGLGPHFCLGASLARLEGAVVLRALSTRFPELRLAEESVTWKPNIQLRGPERLVVDFGRA